MTLSLWLLALLTKAIILGVGLNYLSYRYLKLRTLRRQRWDLNICCGKTDGGGLNADVVRHASVPNFVLIDDIYRLPFRDGEFATALCSHAMEHVEDPALFLKEIKRVSRRVVLVLPPLWDLAAVLNVAEHKWIFLTFRKEHDELPARIRLPLSRLVQAYAGQAIRA